MSMPARILVVDDDVQMRALLREALTARGFAVVEAGSGRQADEAMKSGRIDLMIVDGLLPDTQGAVWIEQQRTRGDKRPIVFATAFWKDIRTYRHLTDNLHVDWVVYKPIDPVPFVDRIQQMLQPRARRPAEPAEPADLAEAEEAEALGREAADDAEEVGEEDGDVVDLEEPTAADDEGSDIDIDMSEPEGADDEAAAELQRALARVKEEYGAALPGRLDELAEAVQRARTSEAALADAIMTAHKLRGTAGSYGFFMVGAAAGEIEDLLRRQEPGKPDEDAWWKIRRAVLDARAAFRAWKPTQSAEAPPAPQPRTADRVLVVDSDEAALTAMAERLAANRLQAVVARNGTEAMAAARALPVGAALIDVKLSGDEDPFALARALRELRADRPLPIAFMSFDGGMDARVAAAHAGASVFLRKPIEPASLELALRDLVQTGQRGRDRVLVLDDDPAAAEHIVSVLATQEIDATVIGNPGDVIEVLDSVEPQLLLLDVEMPRISGFDVCRAVRAVPRWRTLPVVFLSAHHDVDMRIAAFRAGGNDFVGKPCVPEELVARIDMHLLHARLLRERVEVDSLTGLLLPAAFLARAEALLAEAGRADQVFSIALLDLDHFKAVNDTRGRSAGDRVLQRVGALLRQRFRPEDLRGRFGGEELVLGFPGQPAEVVAALTKRVLAELQAEEMTDDEGARFQVSASGGVATFPADGRSMQELIRKAGRRLHAAKEQGRARVVATGA